MKRRGSGHILSLEPESDDLVRGVFWVIDNRLPAITFREGAYPEGVAKSGNTYNHERLWSALRISDKPFDYYPRGRVHVSARGRVTVYVSPHIDVERWMAEIKASFRIGEERCHVVVDHSAHYRCHFDEGWLTSYEAGQAMRRKRS